MAYVEYHSNGFETSDENLNGDFSRDVSRYNQDFRKSPTNPHSMQSNVENSLVMQPSSQQTHWTNETMTKYEKEHYKKALKEIYDAVRLRTQSLDNETDGTSQSEEETFSQNVSSPTSISEVEPFTVGRKKPKKKRLNESELKEIYKELRIISQKLKDETHELQIWQGDLEKREAMLNDHKNIITNQLEVASETFEEELQRRCSVIDQEYEGHLSELQKVIHEKSKEACRLRDSFNTIRTTHDDLRKQFIEVQDQNRFLESQTLSLQQRLNNLLRKNEYQQKQRQDGTKINEKIDVSTKRNNDDSLKAPVTSKFNQSGILDVLSSLFIWISDSQLDYVTLHSSKEQKEKTEHNEAVYGKCVKILPPLADLLSYLPAVNASVMFPLLKFLYSVILYMEQSHQGTQKSALLSTLRRIGEELYKPEVIKQPEVRVDMKKNKSKPLIYIRSSNLNERILSTLIILKTISRADYLSHTFDVLKSDLRDEEGKRLFILYNGVQVIVPFMKPKNNVFLEFAIDITLQMSMESDVLTEFLTRCSTSDFFNVCTNLLQEKGLELKMLEKLSIILQRLSKIRSNKRYFEAFQLVPLIQEHLRHHDSDNAFLSLNLRSVLVNISGVQSA